MVALGLLILLGLYITLLVVAWKVPNTIQGKLIFAAIVLSPVFWKTWDIPYGYFRFKQACESEAGFKVYDQNPTIAKSIRLEGSEFGASYAEGVLKHYPSLLQIEAADNRYSYLTPPAYGRYERQPDGSIISTLIDSVGKVNGQGETKVIEAGPSTAMYVIKASIEYFPHRLHRLTHVLNHADGHLIATVTYFGYTDTDPDKSLFGATWGHGEGCGPQRGETDLLLSLVASTSPRN